MALSHPEIVELFIRKYTESESLNPSLAQKTDGLLDVPLGSGVLTQNIGIPIAVVCTKVRIVLI